MKIICAKRNSNFYNLNFYNMFRNIRTSIPREQNTFTLVELVEDKFREVDLSPSLPSSVLALEVELRTLV